MVVAETFELFANMLFFIQVSQIIQDPK